MIIKLKNKKLFKTKCYINGKWQNSLKTINVQDPFTLKTIAKVPDMGKKEILYTIESALKAQIIWTNKTANERSIILQKWFNLIMLNQDDLALILTLEQGKPILESKGEIAYGASYIKWFSEEATRIYGDIIPALNINQKILITKQAIGVCAAITPWNFPNAMITRKVAPALAAGCSIIVKPASQTPLSAFALAYLAGEAGIPDGVFNVITGDAEIIGKILTQDDRIKKFSFTGSTIIGRKLMSQCSSTIKKISMELGGNAPFIVFDDADIDHVIKGAMESKFRNSGQTCVCANRFYVHKNIYDNFINKLIKQVKQLKIGNPFEENTNIGPLIDDNAIKKMQSYIEDCLNKGAFLAYGGKISSAGKRFFEPTIIKNVNSTMKISQEEIFGPIVAIFQFSEEKEVIKYANDTIFGLASYIYTKDLIRAIRLYEKLEYAMISINSGILSNSSAPFGGIKQSGIGREGSKYGIDEYLEIKYILLSNL